ncbi:hypothetical protein BGZ93_006371 [Podila epicladia]|nr:hypothetical protein BGZ93_006371 [Podila epicladia]
MSSSNKKGAPSKRGTDSQDDSKPTAKKPMFSIFDKKSNVPAAKAPIKWQTYGTSCIVGEAFDPKVCPKVASYDLDSTLISVNGKHKWPKNSDDWIWWAPGVPARLKEVSEAGHALVVITNQGGLDGKPEKQEEMKLKFEKICGKLQLPMWILISMQKDHNRKPMTGLWHWLEAKFQLEGVTIDRKQSYYVGDAAGRHDGWKVGASKDFNNTDRKFAESLGLIFHTPEHYFLNQECPEHKWSFGDFDPKKWPKNLPLFSPSSTPLLPSPGTCELILLCGFPASGKSSFAKKHILSTNRYEWVNQDTLKTRDKCLKAVEDNLKQSKPVVVGMKQRRQLDTNNTNPDVATRAPYIALAKQYNVPVRCFLFQADKDLALHNNYFRAFHRSLVEAEDAVRSLSTSSDASAQSSSAVTTTTTTEGPGEQAQKTSSISSKEVTVTRIRDEPARERISEMVFFSYAKKYQEPTLQEGFSEIKRINFVPDEDIRASWEKWYL